VFSITKPSNQPLTQGAPRVPIVHVQLLEGRSSEQKIRLMAELTQTMERCLGVDPDRVQVQVSEFAEGSWSRGGLPLRRPAQDAQ
jgi:4-oxalocrotonate tautomerase